MLPTQSRRRATPAQRPKQPARRQGSSKARQPKLIRGQLLGNSEGTAGALRAARLRPEIIELLAGLAAEHGSTVIVAPHDATLAARAPRRVQMRDGVLAGGLAAPSVR
jgi:hypothetical protein